MAVDTMFSKARQGRARTVKAGMRLNSISAEVHAERTRHHPSAEEAKGGPISRSSTMVDREPPGVCWPRFPSRVEKRALLGRRRAIPICPTCRSSYAPPMPARRRRSSRTRSPIRDGHHLSCRAQDRARFSSSASLSHPVRGRHEPYWARSRGLEYRNQVQSRLPPRETAWGRCDGRRWVTSMSSFDRSNSMDPRASRFYRLVPNTTQAVRTCRMASVGSRGAVQIGSIPTPARIQHQHRKSRSVHARSGVGGSVLELAEAEYCAHQRVSALARGFRKIPSRQRCGRAGPSGDVAQQGGPKCPRHR